MKIGIIGSGLMGGSLQKGIANGIAKGIDGVLLEGDWIEKIEEIDILILATPITAILEIAEKIAKRRARKKLLVLDIGSVKKRITETFEKLTDGFVKFLGSHPMAGTEKSGYENSDPKIFQGAVWVITPHNKNTEGSMTVAEELIRSLGAKPMRMDAAEHDRRAAIISQLPYLISKTLFDFVDPESLAMAGPGFKSMIRLAADNLEMRRELGRYNRENIAHCLKQYIDSLTNLLGSEMQEAKRTECDPASGSPKNYSFRRNPMKKIAYQGVPGSYSHMTALRLFGTEAAFLGLSQFSDVIEAVEKGSADAALLAIENTLIGPIYEVLDLIGESTLEINGETPTRIEHCLLTLPDAEIEEIRTVYSHPKALGQCLKFFRKHPNLLPEAYVDTAAAAGFVAKKKDPSAAAIASRMAGSIHGLKVCLANIEDNPENFTRFLLLSTKPSEGPKCTIRITLEHKPGKLAEILSVISKEGVNVTSIISRPLIGRPFEYAFYLDLETPSVSLLEEIKGKSKTFRNLGRYGAL